MLTFMGLHALEKEVPYTPTLSSEYNRRLVAQIFNNDKFCVAFSGRPPLLNRRYCTTPLPLDLRDEDLVADDSTLQKAVRELDDRGWNTKGEIYPVTLIRARRMLAAALEEVMEIALGCQVCVTLDQLRYVTARNLFFFLSKVDESSQYLLETCRANNWNCLRDFPRILDMIPKTW